MNLKNALKGFELPTLHKGIIDKPKGKKNVDWTTSMKKRVQTIRNLFLTAGAFDRIKELRNTS